MTLTHQVESFLIRDTQKRRGFRFLKVIGLTNINMPRYSVKEKYDRFD